MRIHPSFPNAPAAFEPLEPRTLLAASLVADLNPDPASSSAWTSSARLGDTVFFTRHSTVGHELWKSDGTSRGTRLVRDINPGVPSADPDNLVPLDDDTLLFGATDDASHGLWRSDGTRKGTVLVKSFPRGRIQDAIAANGLVFFSINRIDDGEARDSLWVTDGTSEGTRVLLNPKNLDIQPGFLLYKRNVLFTAEQEPYDRVLWRTKGTPQSTKTIDHIDADSLWIQSDVRVLGRHLIYNHSGFEEQELWAANLKRTWPVADLQPGRYGGAENLTVLGDKLYFSAEDGTHGEEPWVSDGTTKGTFLLKDLVTSPNHRGSHPNDFFAHDGAVYFNADDDDGERALYKTDGTPEGTVLVGPPGAVHTQRLFAKDDANGILQLWRADAPDAQPVQVTDFTDPKRAGLRAPLTMLDDRRLLYTAYDARGDALWITNGTPEGTHRLRRIPPRTLSSNPSGFGAGHDAFYFGLTHPDLDSSFDAPPIGAGSLWRIRDGNAPEKIALLDGAVDHVIAADGFTYFTVRQTYTASSGITAPISYYDLWRTDGTTKGTYKLFDDPIFSTLYSTPPPLAMLNGELFYGSLWKTDGTKENRELVIEASADELIRFDDQLVLLDYDGDRILITDGTAAGSRTLADYSTDRDRFLTSAVRAGDRIYFVVSGYDETKPDELWTTDGTPNGTSLLKRFPAGHRPQLHESDGILLFEGHDPKHGHELWRSDGTPEGTRLLKDIKKGSASSAPRILAAVGNLTYFMADDARHGRELWRTDGTRKRTVLVADLHPGPAEPFIQHPTAVAGNLLFTANDGVHGTEPWIIRPNQPPALLADIFPGRESSDPTNFAPHNNLLYFSANDYLHGRELWSTPL